MTQLDEPPEDPYADETHAGGTVTPIHGRHINHEAERALITAALRTPELAEHLTTLVDPDDFDIPKHEQIWDAITTTIGRGLEPDPVAVKDTLTASGEFPRLAQAYVNLVANDMPAGQGAYYARLVHEAATARRAVSVAHKMHQQLLSAPIDDFAPHLADALQDLDGLVAGHQQLTNNGGLVDLTWLLHGDRPEVPPPAYVHRSDGHAIFYAGKVNGIFGDPEAAKTWLAMLGLVQALGAGQRASFVDVDHNGQDVTVDRLMLLGATPQQLADPDLFRYYEPEDGDELKSTIAHLVEWNARYVILDSLGEMLPMLGVDSTNNDEISTALRTCATVLARIGTCVVHIDHLPKAQEARQTGFAIGGTAKKRATDGAYIHAETKMPPAPGALGKVVLRVEKDRAGRLRQVCTGKYLGTFVLDSRVPGQTDASIENESGVTETGTFRPTGVMEQISRFVEEHDQASFTDIKATVSAKDATLRAAIGLLVEEGFMSTHDGGRRRVNHHTIALFREDDDDQN